MSAGPPIVEASRLERRFTVERAGPIARVAGRAPRVVRAVDDVALRIDRGEVVGLVGESGSGKTTLARVIAGLSQPSAGTIALDGVDVSSPSPREFQSMRRRIQVVFQDAVGSLSPRRRIGGLLTEPYRIHDVPASERTEVPELLEMVGLAADVAERYPHELSGGQARRVVIARALALRPELLIADEPTAGLDVSTAATVLNLMRALSRQFGLAMLVITHDLGVVASIADRVDVMYFGQIVETGPVADVLGHPSHPYTRALRSAVALPGSVAEGGRIVLRGEMPDPADPPTGCRFRTRCPWAREGCEEPPALRAMGPVEVRCHFAEQIKISSSDSNLPQHLTGG
ncbi:MAG TPA: ABC transporter ATP-binding protein [Actinomycetota bacterium]|jgi:oligopeptide/dipeptide ABC transporter ATP-binding protein|nr:ABC transporter ATP-binding protein [Actinomycetota bacterium]